MDRDTPIVCKPKDVWRIEEKFSAAIFPCKYCSGTDHSTSQCFVWKTKMCWNAKKCFYGSQCSFAHSLEEIRRPFEKK